MQGGNGSGDPGTQKSDCRFSVENAVENATYGTGLFFVGYVRINFTKMTLLAL